MTAVVRLALARPYTFVVMAILIVIFGALSRRSGRRPTSFPTSAFPVIAVVWTYTGLPPDDMSGRIVSYYERTLSTTVNDIEHIEVAVAARLSASSRSSSSRASTSAPRTAQVTSVSQTVLKQLPPGITPPHDPATTPRPCRSCSSRCRATRCRKQKLFDLAQNFIRPQLATVAGAAMPSPYGGKARQVQVDLDQQALQAHGLSAAGRRQRAGRAEPDHPGRHGEDRRLRIQRRAQRQRRRYRRSSTTCRSRRSTAPPSIMRDVGHVHDGSPPQTNVVRVDGRQRGADVDPEDRLGLDARHHRTASRRCCPSMQATLPPELASSTRSATSRPSCKPRSSAVMREGVDRGGADRPDDPAVPRQLALDPDHHDLDPAGDPVLADRRCRRSARRSTS